MGKIRKVKQLISLSVKATKKGFKILKKEGLSGVLYRMNNMTQNEVSIITKSDLLLRVNRVFDLPDIVLDSNRKKTINVLVPAFEFSSISAGFFGVFQTALLFKRNGHNVRLVLFDNFYFDYEQARKKLLGYPGLETLFDEVEVAYIGERLNPLHVSENDTSLATVWYSAYFAEKIQKTCNNAPFFYLIQDYETHFYSGSTNAMLAEQTYKMNFNAMFSTKMIQEYFLQNNVGEIRDRNLNYIFYNNCCSRALPTEVAFVNQNTNKSRRKLIFYSRPVVDRNMFDLGALLIITAIERKLINVNDWDFYGIGLGNAPLKLSEDRFLCQLPRMNLKDYMESISGYDLGISLMASAHPSLVPFDLAGSGCVVLTNNCYNKNQKYFDEISSNIISADPNLEDLLQGFVKALSKVDDLSSRYNAANDMNFPTTWEETWTENHCNWINNLV